MEDWVDQKAREIKEREKTLLQEREWQLHAAREIRAKGPEILEHLAAAVEKDVQRFNERFPDDLTKRIETFQRTPPSGFFVRRTYFPDFTLGVQFTPGTDAIEFEWEKSIGWDSGRQTGKGKLSLRLDETGEIYLRMSDRNLTYEEASRNLLEPLLNDLQLGR